MKPSLKKPKIYAVGLGGVLVTLYGIVQTAGASFDLHSLNFAIRSKSGFSAMLFLVGGGAAAVYWSIFELRMLRDAELSELRANAGAEEDK